MCDTSWKPVPEQGAIAKTSENVIRQDNQGGLKITGGNAAGGSTEAESMGGGIYCLQSSPRIHNNLIDSNTVEGSVSHGGDLLCQESSPVISNNTTVSNVAEGSNANGGGIFCYDSSPNIFDCIIWGNHASTDASLFECCDPCFCCIEGWDGGGEGNVSDDPMFIVGPLGEYYLHPDSPCIDAGSRSAFAAGLSSWTTQVSGSPDTGAVDIGYHYPIPAKR